MVGVGVEVGVELMLQLDDEDYELLGYGAFEFALPVEREQAKEILRGARLVQDKRWDKAPIERGHIGPSASKQKTAAWKAATKRYEQSAKGRAVRSKKNRKQYEKRKADPVKYAAWLAANRARYAARQRKD